MSDGGQSELHQRRRSRAQEKGLPLPELQSDLEKNLRPRYGRQRVAQALDTPPTGLRPRYGRSSNREPRPRVAYGPEAEEPEFMYGRERIVRNEWGPQAIVGAALALVGAVMMVDNMTMRSFDASVTGWLAQFVGIGPILVEPGSQIVYWSAGLPGMAGIRVTAECTSAFLVGPAFIIGGLVMATGRFTAARTLVAVAAATAIMLIANWTRLTVIAWATANWGIDGGYQWSHTVVGSLIALLGVLLALVAFLIVLIRRPREDRLAHV